MDKEIQDMLNDLPNNKFAKYSDKHLESFENLRINRGSENIRKKISQTLKGKTSGFKGFKLTEEHKKIISNTQKGKKLKDETKEKLRIINLGKTSGIPVNCFLYPSMEFYKKYDNLSDAVKELNLHRECARLTCVGKRNHTNGYTFRYIN
jgi:hypothetical protein